MARRRSFLRNAGEYLLARSILGSMSLLPSPCIPAASRLCGRILYRVLSGRRRVVHENLALVKDASGFSPDPGVVGRQSFASLCRSFLELTHLPKRLDVAATHFTFRDGPNQEEMLRIIREDGPIVFAGCHFGAYEAAVLYASVVSVEASVLVRPLDNPWLEAFLNSRRTRHGQRIIGNKGGIRALSRDLKSGRSVGVMTDINQRGPNAFFVNFFGVQAATAGTAAILAWRRGRPLVPYFIHRGEKPMHFEVEITPPIWPDPTGERDAEVQRLLQAVTDRLEARIRETPGEWMWTHRRFKSRPPEEMKTS